MAQRLLRALFGWHPLRVESVAWIAERKDVLSVFFFLLTLLLYLRYARQPAFKAYSLVFVSLAFGLLAKPMLVMAPVLLLLLDYWPLKRLNDAGSLRSLVIEKIPFFPLSIASAIVTVYAQHAGGAVVSLHGKLTLYPRLNNSACSAVAYIAKLLVPIHLAPYYIFPLHQSLWKLLGALILLALVTLLCILGRNRRFLLVGWLWFIVSLLPVIGLLQVRAQSMADRYSYIPSIGLLIAIVWLFAHWYDRQRSIRPLLVAMGACATIVLLPMTYRQIGFWKNDFTLFTYTCAVTQENWFCEGVLADVLVHEGDLEDAEMHIRKSLSILPHYPSSEETLARIIRLRLQRLPGEAEYAWEIRANRSDPLPHYNWANLLLRGGHVGDAIIHYVIYLDARPNDQQAHNNLGIALAMGGDLPAAEDEFDKAIQLDPTFVDAQYGLGTVLLRQGKYSEAATRFGRRCSWTRGCKRRRAAWINVAPSSDPRRQEVEIVERQRPAFSADVIWPPGLAQVKLLWWLRSASFLNPLCARPASQSPDLLIASALAVITFLLFAHAAKNDFMMIDDGGYVAQNPHVQAGLTPDSLRWAMTSFQCANWHPLTWISHEMDCQLFGPGPAGPHLMNAGIHAINTSLLFVVLLAATVRHMAKRFLRGPVRLASPAGGIGRLDRRAQRCAVYVLLSAHSPGVCPLHKAAEPQGLQPGVYIADVWAARQADAGHGAAAASAVGLLAAPTAEKRSQNHGSSLHAESEVLRRLGSTAGQSEPSEYLRLGVEGHEMDSHRPPRASPAGRRENPLACTLGCIGDHHHHRTAPRRCSDPAAGEIYVLSASE